MKRAATHACVQPGLVVLAKGGRVVFVGRAGDPWEDVDFDTTIVNQCDLPAVGRRVREVVERESI